jgi:resuscitation-promoting factor RpfB
VKPSLKTALAGGCLLALGACGSGGVPKALVTPPATTAAATTAASPEGARTATPAPATSSTSAPASPVVEKRTVTYRRPIPFKTISVSDSTLAKGTTTVRDSGARGEEVLTYTVTFVNEAQTRKELVKTVIARAPVTRVIAVGTKEAPKCDPNYSGACVPIASDVDCAGGSGNGPAYVQGPVTVIGTDIYGLDRDGDGIGCEQD